jgi:hypothetical protein
MFLANSIHWSIFVIKNFYFIIAINPVDAYFYWWILNIIILSFLGSKRRSRCNFNVFLICFELLIPFNFFFFLGLFFLFKFKTEFLNLVSWKSNNFILLQLPWGWRVVTEMWSSRGGFLFTYEIFGFEILHLKLHIPFFVMNKSFVIIACLHDDEAVIIRSLCHSRLLKFSYLYLGCANALSAFLHIITSVCPIFLLKCSKLRLFKFYLLLD